MGRIRNEKKSKGKGASSIQNQGPGGSESARYCLSELTVKSYNVLAPKYYLNGGGKMRDIYAYVQDDCARDDSHRLKCLLESLVLDMHDILCLQEIEQSWFEHISSSLQRAGYQGEFQPKAKSKEGVATFWLASKFLHVSSQCIDVGAIENGLKSSQRSLMVHLQGWHGSRGSTQPMGKIEVTVVNNHLIGHPKLNKERAEQAKYVVDSIANVNPQKQEEGALYFAIVCGDMNSRPGSDMLNLMRSSGYENAGEGQWGNTSGTAYINGRWATIDHILYTVSNKDAIQYVSYECPMVSEPIPNQFWPSDHLPIHARFVLHEAQSA